MFRSKKDVDRHVTDIMSKIHNENERSLRGYNFARLYFQVKDHEAAKKHLQAYLSVRTHHAPSHKLLAQIYEATHDIEKALQSYKRSLEIDNKQKDIILKICELYCNLPVDHETARYWADRADQLFPHNDIVFKLRECLMTADGEPNRQELENLIYAELAAQPNNITLRMKLLKLYLDSERVKEAYEHVVKLEKKTPFPTSTEWYSMLVDIFEAYQDEFGQELDFSFYVQFLTALDHLVFLSLAEPHAVHFENDRNGIQVASNSDTGMAARVLQQFDRHLKKAAEKDLTHGAWLYFFRHMKGQLYMHMGSLILKSARKDHSKWKEACRFAAALFLVGYTFKPSNLLQEVWFLQMDEQQKLFTNFFHKGAMRTSFVGHVIISLCKEEEKSKWLQKIKRDVCLWQVRERIYNKLFCNTNEKGNVSNSYFLSDAAFVDSSLEFPQIPSLLEHDKSSYKLWPSSLHHLTWLHLHQKDMNVESFQSSLHELFKSLRFSNNNLSKGSPESLCMLDIEAYLLAVLYTTNLYLEQKIALGGYGSDFSLTVPPNIADPLCTTDQATWWHSAYGLVNNNIKERLGEHRRILQRGLEVIRGVGNHGLEIQLVVHLARAFADKAAALSQESEILHHIENENKKVNSDKVSALESRAVHYWNIALSMLRTLAANQTLRMPKDRMFNGYSNCLSTEEITALNEEGKLYLACRLMNSEKLEEAIEVLEKLESPYASYYLALTFKKMALQESTSGTRSALLHKARDALYTTMDRIKGETTHTLNEDIYIEVEEIESEIGKHLNFANANISKDSSGADECDDSQTSYKATSKPATPLQIPKCVHSTPRPCSSFMTAKSKPDQSSSRTHLEPSPERLDAQIRALALTQSTLIKTLVEQQRSLLDTNKAIIEELKQNKDVVVELTRQLEELQLSTRKARHKIGPKKTIPKGQGEEDEEDYTDYETNGYLDYYVDDSMDNYQQNSYNHSRVVNDGAAASAMSYVPSAGLPAVPPPTIPYGYQYPPPTHHGIAPPPPHGAIPEGSHYYPAAINHGLPFSEGQPLPQFRFHVGSSMVKPPPVMNSIASIPQQNIPVVPPPGVTSISQAHSSPSWAKPGTPHAFQIPLPSTGVGSSMSQPPAVLSAPSPFVSSSANQTPSSYIAASSTVTSTVQSANSDSYLKSILSSTSTPVAPQAVGQFAIVNSSPNSATSSAFSFANSGITNHTPEETRNNRSRQDSDVYSDADVEREVMGDFKPVIPLPEEVVVQTGEEDETVLFENRAKLFRFVDREWKERGTGSVKILKLEATGRVRLLMRRDQVHKVCANHRILPNMEITDLKGSDRALTWAAQDFADETVKLEQFCIRFKTADIAANFRKAFEDAVKYAKLNEEKKNSPAISITSASSNISSIQPITSQGFGGKGLPKPGSWNCPTCLVSNPGSKMSCMACETEKPGSVVKNVELPTNYNNNMPPFTVNSAKPVTTTPVTNLCNFSGKPFIYQTPVISVNETLPPKESHAFSGATPSSGDISDSSGLHAAHQTPGAGIFGNFSFTSSDIVSESDSSIPLSQQSVTASKGETTDTESKSEATSFNFSSSKFLNEKTQDNTFISSEAKPSGKPVSTFGGFTFISTPVVTEKTEETKDREILVVTTKSKDGPQVSKVDATKSPFTGFSFKGASDFATKPDAKNSFSSSNQEDQTSKPIFGTSSKFPDFGFSPFSGDTSTNSFSSGSPLFVTVNKDGRRVSGELKKDNSKDVKGIAESQSSLNNIPSAEKDDEIVFSEKVCLYCYDSKNSEWKERDKGHLLLLHSKSAGKYRIQMHGDKTTTLSLNHCIHPKTKLSPLSSEATWMWEVQDYSSGLPKDEKFAAKFKNPAVAKKFYDLYEKCRSELGGTSIMESGLKVDVTSKSTSKPDANINMELPSSISDPCSQNRTLFSDLFKPAPDSWECTNCYIRNEKNVKNCMACEYPKSAIISSSVEDKSSVSWECSMCHSQNSEKETSCSHCGVTRKDSGGAKPLSEMYKPDPSSWECTACYVRNDKTLTKCQACETPKPGTLKTPAATSATHSVFGHFEIKSSAPFPSGFVFGSKDSLAKPTLQFGAFANALSSTTDFTSQFSTTSDGAATVFGGKTVPSQPAGGSGDSAASGFAPSRPIPPVTAPPSFVFGRSQADSSSSIFSKSDSSQEPSVFPFGNSSSVSSGETQTESSDSVEFRFGSPQKYEFHFGGVRPRSPSKCPKSPRSPGTPTDAEEEEEEAELSDADNIYFQPVIPLPPKVDVKTGEEDETVLFNKRAKLFRFSDGEWKERGIGDVKILYNSAQGTVRLLMRRDQVLKVCLNHYVTADTIFTWKSNKSLSWAAVDYSEHEASPEQFAIRFKVAETAIQFENTLDSALKLCKVSDGLKVSPLPKPPFPESQTSTDAVKKRLDFSQSDTELVKQSDDKSAAKSYAEKLSSFSFSLDKTKSETSSTPFSLASRFETSTGTKSGSDAVSSFFAKPSEKVIPDSSSQSDKDIEIIYNSMDILSPEQIAAAKKLMLPPTFYLYENKQPCPGCRGCEDDLIKKKESPCAKSVPQSVLKPDPVKVEKKSTEQEQQATNLFSNTSLSVFSFADLTTTNTGFDALKGNAKSTKAAFPGAGAPVFGNTSHNDEEDGGGDDDAQGPDIHFEPVIPLPDIIEVKTGEEDEVQIFCNRAKLYRYDTETKQWKERGIGDLKILQHKEKCRFRILFRRDQVHKVACNHVITTSMKLNPMSTSENSWCWSAVDYAEGRPENSQFAVRFKNKDILEQFRSQFEACKGILSTQTTGSSDSEKRNDALQCAASEANVAKPVITSASTAIASVVTASPPDNVSWQQPESPGEVEYDDDQDEEEDDEDIYSENVSLEVFDETTNKYQHAGTGLLQVLYDDTVYGYRIIVTDDSVPFSGVTLCNHVIAVQTCLRVDNLVATWAASDVSVKPTKRRQFRATFQSHESVHEFARVFEDGKEIAVEAEIIEKEDNIPVVPDTRK